MKLVDVSSDVMKRPYYYANITIYCNIGLYANILYLSSK